MYCRANGCGGRKVCEIMVTCAICIDSVALLSQLYFLLAVVGDIIVCVDEACVCLLCSHPHRVEALRDDVRLTSVCMTSVCHVHRAYVESREA